MKLSEVHSIVFDFDGVFTDNFVYTDSNGRETVRTSRSDSLGLNIFRNYCEVSGFNINMLILSTESNSVVGARAKKLNLQFFSGVNNKAEFLAKLKDSTSSAQAKYVVFLGNDLNDLEAMKIADFSFAPSDAHPQIKAIASWECQARGGEGFVREALELMVKRDSQ